MIYRVAIYVLYDILLEVSLTYQSYKFMISGTLDSGTYFE